MKNLKRLVPLVLAVVLVMGTVSTLHARAAGGITVTEQPAADPDEIKIVKESSGKTITTGTAIFKVEYFANDSWSGKATRTWYYKTINGVTSLNSKTYFLATSDFGKSDAMYEYLGQPTIPLGTIRVTEAQAPEGYLKSNFQLDGKITQPSNGKDAVFAWTSKAGGTIRYVADTAYIHNDQIKGNLKIVKRDAYEDKPLSGAGFRILDKDGKTVTEGYTDKNGEVTFKDLVYGDYFYQEFEAPLGYKLDETKYPFSITENGVTVTKTQTDKRRDGTIQVKKLDTDGSAVPGAVFLLEYSTDKGGTWSPVKARAAGDDITIGGCTSPGLKNGQLTTGTDGTATFTGLRADSEIVYRLTETEAPEGMTLLGGPIYVGTLPVKVKNLKAEDSQIIDNTAYCYTLYVTATDSSVFRLPETGGASFTFLPLAMLPAAVPIILIKRKKEVSE